MSSYLMITLAFPIYPGLFAGEGGPSSTQQCLAVLINPAFTLRGEIWSQSGEGSASHCNWLTATEAITSCNH